MSRNCDELYLWPVCGAMGITLIISIIHVRQSLWYIRLSILVTVSVGKNIKPRIWYLNGSLIPADRVPSIRRGCSWFHNLDEWPLFEWDSRGSWQLILRVLNPTNSGIFNLNILILFIYIFTTFKEWYNSSFSLFNSPTFKFSSAFFHFQS